MKDHEWGRTAVAYYDWVNCGEAYWDENYPAFKVERAASFGANVLMLSMQIGGYSVYPSKWAATVPRLGYDMLAKFRELTHQRDMRLVVYWLGTTPGAALQLELHPDWQQRDEENKPIGCMCYVSPYGRHTLGQVKEILAGYDVDGVYFDQMPVGCFCSFCQAKFKVMFNRDLMELVGAVRADGGGGFSHLEAEDYGEAALSGGSQIRQFIQANTDWWIGSVRSIIDQTRPKTIYQQGKLFGPDLARYADQVDAVLPEVLWWSVGGDLDRLALSRWICKAYSAGKPIYDEAKYDDTNIDRRCLEEVKLLLGHGLTCDGQPLLREARVADLAPRRLGDLQQYMGQLRALVEHRAKSEPIITGSLLHSQAVEMKHDREMGPSISGACRILRENQILMELITEEDLSATMTEQRPLIVVPEYGSMGTKVEHRLVDYIGAGGNAVVVLGDFDHGSAINIQQRPLMKMLGMRYLGLGGTRSVGGCPSLRSVGPIPSWSKRYLNYGQITDAAPLTEDIDQTNFTFLTPYLEAQYNDACRVLVNALDFDHEKANARHFNRRAFWPGDVICPIAVAYEGSGRVVFISTSAFDMEFRRRAVEMDTLLARAMRWAAGKGQEIEMIQGPATIRIAGYVNEEEREYTILLANLATNDLKEGAIRQVHASGEIVLRIAARFPVQTATAFIGGQCVVEPSGEGVTLRVPSVRFLEGIVLK